MKDKPLKDKQLKDKLWWHGEPWHGIDAYYMVECNVPDAIEQICQATRNLQLDKPPEICVISDIELIEYGAIGIVHWKLRDAWYRG